MVQYAGSSAPIGNALTQEKKPPRLVVCGGGSCKHGRKKVCRALAETLAHHDLSGQVEIRRSGCQNRCKHGPNLTLMPGGFRYGDLSPKRARNIVELHLVGGMPIETLLAKRKKKKRKK